MGYCTKNACKFGFLLIHLRQWHAVASHVRTIYFIPDEEGNEAMKRYSWLFVVAFLGSAAGFAAEVSIGPLSGSGFAINPINHGTINVAGVPAGSVVNSVTVRVMGTAPYAELCTFQLRDSSGTILYNLPTWYDEFSFDRTASGITAFAGRPVNQAWELWGQGSNTSGERVDQWWITIYYDEPLPDPSVRIVGPASVEVNDTLTLRTVITNMTGPYTYQWSKDSAVIIGATDAEYVIPIVQYADAGTYTVSVTDGSSTTYDSPDFELQVVAENSLPASSRSMLGCLMLLVIVVGTLCVSRRRRHAYIATE